MPKMRAKKIDDFINEAVNSNEKSAKANVDSPKEVKGLNLKLTVDEHEMIVRLAKNNQRSIKKEIVYLCTQASIKEGLIERD